MDLHQYDIFEQCTQEDPIVENTGQSIGRCKIPNTRDPKYVPIYVPKLVIPEPNCDPRRYEGYCKPVRVLSQPLSNDEYLRKKLLNGGRPLSKSYLLQTPASLGQYRTTLWTAAGTSYLPSNAYGEDLGIPLPLAAPPVTGTNGTAIDAGTLTQMRMAVAGRGDLSAHDSNGRRFGSTTTLRRMGKAIISNPAGFGGFNEACIACDLSGTSLNVTVGQFKCTCEGPEYELQAGPFSLLWGQLTNAASYTTPALSPDGRLLYVGSSPYIYGIDVKTGNYIWEFQNPFTTDNFVYSNIAVGPDGTVYVGGSFSNYFFAINGLTGALKWHYVTSNSDNYFSGKPAFNPLKTMVYVTSNGPLAKVYAFNFAGNLLYTYTNTDLLDNDTVQSVGVGADGRVYVSYDQSLIALTEGLTFRWSAECGRISGTYNSDWFSPRIDSSGLIYVGSDTDTSKLYCFIDNGSSGTLEWTYEAPGPSFVLSPVFGPSGQVYIASNRNNNAVPATINNAGSLLSLSSNDGSIQWTYNFIGESTDFLNWIYPTVGPTGRIYVTNVVDSSLVILNDLGTTFGYYKEISISDADSGIYGSLCLSPPCAGNSGLVYWCNGNNNLPGIYGAGFPIITEVFKSEAPAPVFIPNIRVAPAGAPTLLPLAKASLPLKLPYNKRCCD
jgi:hypothetical protein